MKIGVFGATIYNHNLGCQALSWSLFVFLEKVSQDIGIEFQYIVFDRSIHPECNKKFFKETGITSEKVEFLLGSTPKLYKIKQNNAFYKKIKECDAIIDITQGDSFSDIYGFKRFITWTYEKHLVEKRKVPFILGPQTYGPFLNEKNRKYAFKIIEKADLVISRDYLSTEYMQKYTACNIVTGIDVAFLLPYRKMELSSEGKINVGLNPSGLLWKQGEDNASRLELKYKTDYRDYLNKLIQNLLENGNYRVFMISHVKSDEIAAKELCDKYPELEYKPLFDDALEAKSFISGLDCFIGSRMHATIAAISSGVPVIPVSYSRKFEGLYSTLQYDYVVSLLELTTEQSLEITIDNLFHLDELKQQQSVAVNLANKKIEIMRECVGQYINTIYKTRLNEYSDEG